MRGLLAMLVCGPLCGQLVAAPPDAVVRITSHGCTGTVIESRGGRSLVLSCAHAFATPTDRAKPITIDAPAPRHSASPAAVGIRLEAVDQANDLTLISVGAELPYVCPIAPAGTRPSRCWSIGYDEMRQPAVVKAATVTDTDGRITYTTPCPWHGRSGGPLVDAGTLGVVGVVQGYDWMPGVGWRGRYVSHAMILSFLAKYGSAPATLGVREVPRSPVGPGAGAGPYPPGRIVERSEPLPQQYQRQQPYPPGRVIEYSVPGLQPGCLSGH